MRGAEGVDDKEVKPVGVPSFERGNRRSSPCRIAYRKARPLKHRECAAPSDCGRIGRCQFEVVVN